MPASQLPRLPGFVVLGPDKTGEHPDRFAAVEEGSRRHVAVQQMPPLYPDERTRIEAELERYAQVHHPHLAAPVRLAEATDVLVLPTGEHRSLARLPDPTDSGQVVTALAPVAQALAALHAAGLAHGEVDAALVVVDAAGQPTLVGAGVTAALHEIAPREIAAPVPDEDVAALLSLARRQAGSCTDRDAPVLHALLDDLAARSAQADEVAARLLELAPAPLGAAAADALEPPEDPEEPEQPAEPEQAVLLTEPEPDPDPPGAPEPSLPREAPGGHEGAGVVGALRRRPWLLGLLPLLAVAVLVGLAIRWATSDAFPATPARATAPGPLSPQATQLPSPVANDDVASLAAIELCGAPPPAAQTAPPTPDDWAEVVDELYTRRSAALVTGQTSLLCDVFDPASPGLTSDLELAAAFERQQVRPDQLTWVVDDVQLDSEQGALVTLTITDRLEAYSLVGSDGRVVAELPGVDAATWTARLVPDETGQEWRFG